MAVADYRRGTHLPLPDITLQSNIRHSLSKQKAILLIHNGFNKHEPNGMTFALISLKACRVKALGQGRFR
ncbi:hypothetical protein EMIT0215P_80110 [Pseudomonas serboccidentalis]